MQLKQAWSICSLLSYHWQKLYRRPEGTIGSGQRNKQLQNADNKIAPSQTWCESWAGCTVHECSIVITADLAGLAWLPFSAVRISMLTFSTSLKTCFNRSQMWSESGRSFMLTNHEAWSLLASGCCFGILRIILQCTECAEKPAESCI